MNPEQDTESHQATPSSTQLNELMVAVESLTPEEQLQFAQHLFEGVVQSIRQALNKEASHER